MGNSKPWQEGLHFHSCPNVHQTLQKKIITAKPLNLPPREPSTKGMTSHLIRNERCQKQGSDKLSSVHRSQNVHQMIAKHFPMSGNLRLSPGHSDIHTNPQLRFCQKKILFSQLHHLFALSKMSEHSRIRAERALTKWPLPSPLCQLELLQVA